MTIGPTREVGASIRRLCLPFAAGLLVMTAAAGHAQQTTRELPPVDVVAPSPLIGSTLDRNTVPAQTHVLDSGDLRRQGAPNLTGALQRQIGSVTLDSASGNPFQPTLFYRGFAASPLQGTPQGLAVYVNGMRFNQPFGDTVDWELIPANAIDRLDIEGSNPVFGLNALGGSVNVQLKNGFTWQGSELALSGGSFGLRQGQVEHGQRTEAMSTYFAGTVLHQDGWRDLQSSDLQNAYGDIGWRSSRGEFHLGVTAAHSELNGPGTSPVELLAVAPRAQFTAPNQITNRYASLTLSGTVDLDDTLSLQGLAYYRYFTQNVNNGNAPNDTPCDSGNGLLCFEATGNNSTTSGGQPIGDFLNGGQYGQLDIQATRTHAFGATAQLSDSSTVLDKNNHLIAGLAFDGARTQFNAASFVGGLTSDNRTFIGPGILIDEPGFNSPVSVGIANNTYGAYLADTFNVTGRLAVTLSGRLNAAFVDLTDQNGGDLSGSHAYVHFNPAAGATYRIASWLTAYAGYAVANRAPTPAELSCASPANSCNLANFFTGDPDLRQVVANTVEAGLRGKVKPDRDSTVAYSLGLFRTDLTDDIAFINSPTVGRAFFANIGSTRRQGASVDLRFSDKKWLAWLAYSFIDATYQTSFTEAAGNNPAADASRSITVQPGSHLPGIPQHQLKAGLSYGFAEGWRAGATVIAASEAWLFGDEANLTAPLPAYATLNLDLSWQVRRDLQFFAWAENVTNTSYYTFGTFSPTSTVQIAQAPGATATRSLSPAAPLGVFAGLRLTF